VLSALWTHELFELRLAQWCLQVFSIFDERKTSEIGSKMSM
jgi:hypothetical protein